MKAHDHIIHATGPREYRWLPWFVGAVLVGGGFAGGWFLRARQAQREMEDEITRHRAAMSAMQFYERDKRPVSEVGPGMFDDLIPPQKVGEGKSAAQFLDGDAER